MATNGDSASKPSDPDDPPSSSTPLLYKPYPPLDEPQPSPPDSDPTQYLQITYNHGPRPFKDIAFSILFLVFTLATFALGVFVIVNRNPDSSHVSSYSYSSNSSSCVKSTAAQTWDSGNFASFSSVLLRELESSSGKLSSVASSSHVLRDLVWTLVITLLLSFPFGLGLLVLLKHYTKQLVYISLPFFIIIPIFVDIYWFVACTVDSNCSESFPLAYRILVLVFVLIIVGIIVWIFVANWHRIELTIRIIGVGSDALLANLGLFGVLPGLTFAWLVYFSPIVVFLVFARLNGKIAVRESSGEYSCVWKQDSWVPAYYALAILTILWSAATMVETQAYVISGTVAQWYFAKDRTKPRRSIRSSLRNAFGPSSGTICLSGLLICIVRVVRSAVESVREQEGQGIVYVCLSCIVNTLLTAIEFLNKFTINFAAITGEAYCTSARMSYELLKRNLLSAVFVETVSTRLLAGIIFVLSAIYTIAVCAILNAATDLEADSYFVAALAWVLLLLILGYFVHVLDNVIDTVYICYAIDRDRGEVCKQDVHEVYVHLPISRNNRSTLPSGSTTFQV
uniref:Choline transporter-like protein n=1 Tax=Kalanchoe fedtschenkoi TaxID=63787 RepID=A0A7N0U5S5_KALFE